MTVYLGEHGMIELRRSSHEAAYHSVVNASDVNATRNRLSFDFPYDMLVTGDQLKIKALDDGLLDFVAPSGWPTNKQYKDGIWYIYVDQVGGITLYTRFDDALDGEMRGRCDLLTPSRDIPIEVEIVNNIDRCVGQVTSFELNTERDAVDVTTLSDEFRERFSTLMSGSGELSCFFDYQTQFCGPNAIANQNVIELPIYLHQLLLRTRLGSNFHARFYVLRRGPKPGSDSFDDEVYFEVEGVLTNAGLDISDAAQPIRSTFQFLTTGPIQLRVRQISNYLLQEQGAQERIRLEHNQSGFIELEQQD